MKAYLTILQWYFRTMSVIAPSIAARSGFKAFQKVRIKNIRQREKAFYERARQFEIPHDKENLLAYEIGDPKGALVILVHGWESNAGSMSKLAEKLEKEGKRVVLFDLPGHAFYELEYTNLLECKEAMKQVLKYLNPQQPFSIVSHSFGSAVTAFCIRDTEHPVHRMVFLTGPNKVENIFREFQELTKMGDRAFNKMLARTENLLGEPISNISIQQNLQSGNYQKLLLIHDKNDKIIPYFNSEEIVNAVENASLEPFENVGHYRMLWNKEIIDRTAQFLN